MELPLSNTIEEEISPSTTNWPATTKKTSQFCLSPLIMDYYYCCLGIPCTRGGGVGFEPSRGHYTFCLIYLIHYSQDMSNSWCCHNFDKNPLLSQKKNPLCAISTNKLSSMMYQRDKSLLEHLQLMDGIGTLIFSMMTHNEPLGVKVSKLWVLLI